MPILSSDAAGVVHNRASASASVVAFKVRDIGTEVVIQCWGGIPRDEAIYRGYCPLGEPEVAIHATNLLYDLLPSFSCLFTPPARSRSPPSPFHSLSVHSWHSLLSPFAPLSLLSWLPVSFFSCVIVGVRECALSRALWRLRRDC